MKKNMIILSVLVLAVVGTIIYTQQQQKTEEQRQMQLKAAEEANKLAAEAQKAINEAKMAEEAAKALQTKINELVFQAKTLLESGEHQKAIDIAKNILSQDADNGQAKSILETAMAKLKEIAQKQTEALTEQAPQKVLENLNTGLNIPGQ